MSEIVWDGTNPGAVHDWFTENVPGYGGLCFSGLHGTLIVPHKEGLRSLHVPHGAMLRYAEGRTFEMVVHTPRFPFRAEDYVKEGPCGE